MKKIQHWYDLREQIEEFQKLEHRQGASSAEVKRHAEFLQKQIDKKGKERTLRDRAK